jgi:hypothetical protein
MMEHAAYDETSLDDISFEELSINPDDDEAVEGITFEDSMDHGDDDLYLGLDDEVDGISFEGPDDDSEVTLNDE